MSESSPVLRPALRQARDVVVTCHLSPDGDAVASVLALTASLRLARWNAEPVIPSPVPEGYRFLPNVDSIRAYAGDEPGGGAADPEARSLVQTAEAIVCLDCSDPERLGTLFADNRDRFARVPVINIDHHATNTYYGAVNLVDPAAASVCEYLTSLMEQEDLPITRDIASALLVGVVADTLGFRTSATTASTMRVAASLMERGASLSGISKLVFNRRSPRALKLWGQVLSRTRVEGRVVWSDITSEMLKESGASLEDADMLIDFIAGVPGTSAAFLFSERDGDVRVSMRTSADLDAAAMASSFGGGGHARAAGCTLRGRIGEVEARLVGEARRRLEPVGLGDDKRQETDA